MHGVYSATIPTLPAPDLFAKLLPYVNEDRRDKVNRFWRHEDAWRSLLAEALTRAAVISATGNCNAMLSLSRDGQGKPSIIGGDGSFLSISHSGNLVVCAFDTHPIGIDVEEIVPVGEESAAVVLSPVEQKTILPAVHTGNLASFFKLWTMKESYAKVSGSGHQIAFDSFSLHDNQDTYSILHSGGRRENAYFQHLPITEGYCCCVCSLTNTLELPLHFFAVEDIAETLMMAEQHG